MTKPLETFREVGRVLKTNAPFITTYSNRMFPTKAVRIWRALDDGERGGLIAAYFRHAACFGDATIENRSADRGTTDPLFAVWARAIVIR
jgi:hypothetical protein